MAKSQTIFIFLLLNLLVLLTFSQSRLELLLPEIQAIISQSKLNLWSEIEPDEPLWNMPPWLGTFFLSEYYFQLKAFEMNDTLPFKSKFNETLFTKKLLDQQLLDGSWKQLKDENRKQGSLDATIFNYWYLKQVGTDMLSTPMVSARKFILSHGGIQKSQMMTQYKLATFGQYEWQLVNYVPLFLFKKSAFPFYSYGYIKDYIAQWVYPHITGLAYLRYHKTIFPVSKVCISQLMTTRGSPPCQSSTKQALLKQFNKLNGSALLNPDPDVDNVLSEALSLYGKRGAIGAYTISTLLNFMALKDYSLRYNNQNNAYVTFYNRNLNKSLNFVEDMYFNRRVPYEGSLDDGRYWDTILAVYALLQAGESPDRLHPTIKYLIQTAVQPNGGIPYGHQFQYAPDIDDTAMLLLLYGKMMKYYRGTNNYHFYLKQIHRTYNWIKSCQNQDGGFPAFHKDKNDGQYPLVKLIFWITKIDKSAQIFDPSCPDIVGHILQGMVQAGIFDKQVIIRSLQYLIKSKKDGMWSARWGINYVYAVGAVYPALAKIGFNFSEAWVMNVTKRLVEVQQDDGGFGQDSEGYNLDRYLKGVTTVSMTSWGMLAYIQAAHTIDIDDNIYRAAKYIINNFNENNGKFVDRSVVGTGHRGLLNLQYPVYAYTFPLVALARLKNYITRGHIRPAVNIELVQALKNKTTSNTQL